MDAELLDAVQRRVTRYLGSRDVEDLMDPAGLRDVTALLNTALPGVPGLADQTRVLDELAGAPPGTDRAPAELVPSITRRGAPLGGIDDAIASTRRWVARQAGADDLTGRMNLAELQQLRFERTGDLADLDAALATAREVLARTPESHPMRPGRLTTLGLLLQVRFAATGELRQFDAGIDALQQACDAGGPDHEDRSMYLSNLGRARMLRYQVGGGDPADLAAALDALRAAVAALRPDELPSARGTRLGALHAAFVLRYQLTHDAADLDEAFRVAREAAEITSPDDHNATDRALDMAHAHLLRYQRSGDPTDAAAATRLAEAVRRSTPDGHPDRERAQRILEPAGSAPGR